MKNSTENQNKKRSANGGAEALKEYRKDIRLIFDLLHLAKTCTKNALPKGEYIRSTHIIEAPAGIGWKTFLHKNRDNSHDLHVFLTKDAFAIYKRGVGADVNKMVITANYSPDYWKKSFAA